VKGGWDVWTFHHFHQRWNGLVAVAARPPPGDVDGAAARLRNPARMALHHRRGARIVEAERRHEVRSEVRGRMMPALRPVFPRIVAVPGVVLEQEVTAEIGVPAGERWATLRSEQRRSAGQRAGGRQAGGPDERSARDGPAHAVFTVALAPDRSPR